MSRERGIKSPMYADLEGKELVLSFFLSLEVSIPDCECSILHPRPPPIVKPFKGLSSYRTNKVNHEEPERLRASIPKKGIEKWKEG